VVAPELSRSPLLYNVRAKAQHRGEKKEGGEPLRAAPAIL
jgi:hypothetical protein